MRFQPPPVARQPELDWLLAAAFGPELPPPPADAARAEELAGRFDLGPRIVARHGTEALGERLGGAARSLIRAHRHAAAVELLGDRAVRRVGAAAAEHALPIVFLKGAALRLAAPGPPGWRPFADLDVLLARPDAAALHRRLVATGWRSEEGAANPHHLAPVTTPDGIPVDVHFRLRGVRVGSERWASAGELLAAELCRPAPVVGATAWLPRPGVLAAHLAAHALEQHGHRPASYPLLRAVADLADLAAADGGEELPAEVARLTAESLTADEIDALFTLARILSRGGIPDGAREAERAAALLLRHIVVGSLDPIYRRGLALDHTAGRLREARRDGALIRYIATKLGASGDRPESGSGRAPEGLGSFGRRLARLLQIGARFATATVARLRRPRER